MKACKHGDMNAARLLLDYGADVNTQVCRGSIHIRPLFLNGRQHANIYHRDCMRYNQINPSVIMCNSVGIVVHETAIKMLEFTTRSGGGGVNAIIFIRCEKIDLNLSVLQQYGHFLNIFMLHYIFEPYTYLVYIFRNILTS